MANKKKCEEAKWTDYKISYCSRCSKPIKRSKTLDNLKTRQEVVTEIITLAEEWKKKTKGICRNCNEEKKDEKYHSLI